MIELLESETADAIPRVMPVGWRYGNAGNVFMRADGMSVILSVERCDDGKRWLHVSCARPDRLVDWGDLAAVKRLFIGDHRRALQVLPPASEHVNVHPHCLHLWACLDGDGLPDFRREGGL